MSKLYEGYTVRVHTHSVRWYCRPIAASLELYITAVTEVTDTTYVAAWHRNKRDVLRLHVQGVDGDGKHWEFWTMDDSEIEASRTPSVVAA